MRQGTFLLTTASFARRRSTAGSFFLFKKINHAAPVELSKQIKRIVTIVKFPQSCDMRQKYHKVMNVTIIYEFVN